MKIIHCADLHLDSKLEANLDAYKAKERRSEILDTFERMVDYAANNGVTAIVIAGDMFDTARIKNSTKTRILNTIRKNTEIDFLYLSGNHDEKNFVNFIEDKPENLKIFGHLWTSFKYNDVNISGVVLDKTNSSLVYNTLNLNPDDFNIVVMHGQIINYNTKADGENINLVNLKNKHIDYLALGHIHSYEKNDLDQRGVYCYSGCLEGRGFDECGEKGFVLLEIQDGKLTTEFIPFAKRKLLEVDFDITNYNDWFEIVEQIIAQTDNISKENLLKVVLKGRYNLKLDKILEMLETKLDRFYFVKIKDESVLDVKPQDVENDISLRGEFIRKVLSSNLTQYEKEYAILVGLKTLQGEDL